MATERKSLLSKYHDMLQEKLEGRRGEFLYRGQEDADWQLRSGAVRRIFPKENTIRLQELIEKHKEDFDFHEEILRYHEEDLLEQAKLKGWHREIGGRELKDLELLAKLQHYGAATCLLDFTTRFDIALWFACKKARGKEKDGIVFIVDIGIPPIPMLWDLRRIGSNDIGCSISKILRFETRKTESQNRLFDTLIQNKDSPKFWYWHPETLMGRMISQESRFLFGLEDIPDDGAEEILPKGLCLFNIQIQKEDKEMLLIELKQHHGLSQESIVSDIQGFAVANNHQASFQRKSAEDYMEEGMKNFHIGKFPDAIKNFDKMVGLNQENFEALLFRAATKFFLGLEKQLPQKQTESELPYAKYYEEAIQDCNEAIKQKPDSAEAYSLLYLLNFVLKKPDEARTNLQTSWRLYDQQGNQKGKERAEEQLRQLNDVEQSKGKPLKP